MTMTRSARPRRIANVSLSTAAIQSLLCDQIGDAIHSLDGRRIGDRAIHDARKSIKKSRALLRLLRYAVPTAKYQEVNKALRDAGAPLGTRRDATILIDTLESLARDRADARGETTIAYMRRTLQRERGNLLRVSRTQSSISASAVILRSQLRRVTQWSLAEKDWPVLRDGLRHIYARGRKSFKTARSRSSAEYMHDWRKQAKYLWHALQVLEPVWPSVVRKLAHPAHRLSDQLGDDHDLFILREKVCALATGSERSRDALLALIDHRRKRLRSKSFALGRKLYEKKPHALAALLDSYCTARKHTH